jgi:hypothetical protein
MRTRGEYANDTNPAPWKTRRESQWEWSTIDDDGDEITRSAPQHIAYWDPNAAKAVADMLDALAQELERGDYTVESDVLPTWLHSYIDNIAFTYLRGEK